MVGQIPYWIRLAISLMYRFVVGGFGVSLPHPYTVRECGPFWIALWGATVGLPIVLLIWSIRLVFGGDRTEKISYAVGGFFELRVVKSIRQPVAAFIVLSIASYAFYSYFREFGWIGVLAFAGVWITLFVVVMGALFAENRLFTKQRALRRPESVNIEKGEKETGLLRRIFTAVMFVPKLCGISLIVILRGLWQMLAFFGLMVNDVYKKHCRFIELP